MLSIFRCAALAAALFSPSVAQPAAQPTQVELEAALRAHYVRVFTYPEACRSRPARGCMKPPKRIKVRNYDCQASGTDPNEGPILYCRVTYIHSGGSLAHVLSRDECVPLRVPAAVSTEDDGARPTWEVALVDSKGRCPGARE